MKRFSKKLVYFRIILALSPLIMASSANDCTKLTRTSDLYKGRPPKETLEEEDKLAMVEKFKKAIDEHNPGLDKSTRLPFSITLALQSLNVYSEKVKKEFLALEEYHQYTLLGYAILKKREDVVKELVKESSIDINKVSGNTNVGSLQLALALTKNIHGSSIAMALLESKKSSELNFTLMVPTIPKENSTTKQETNEKPEANNILHQAIINDYFNVIQQLVSETHKAKIKSILNKPNHNKHTPLQLAIDKYLHFVREQTDNSNKDKNDNAKKISSTHTVYDQWYAEVMEYLLALEQIDLMDITSNTWSDFIKTAYQNQDKKLIDLLLKHNNAPTTQIAKQAIKNKDGKLLQLLANNDTINLFSISYPLSKKANDTPTLLYELVKENQLEQVELVIRYFGTSHGLFRKKDIKSQPILEKAVEHYIKYLSVPPQGGVEAYYAKKEYVKTRDIIKLLLDDLNLPHANFARLNSENAASWIKVIENEVTNGEEDLIKLLANHKNFTGSLLDKALQAYAYQDNSGDGFLHRAVRAKDSKDVKDVKRLKKVQILTNFTNWINLQNGKNKNNDTALHIALYNGGCELTPDDIVIIEELLKVKGIDVNIKNCSSNTPLHFAAAHGSYEIAEKLIKEYHTDKTILNNEEDHTPRRTPYDIAKSKYPGDKDLLDLLENKK